jgi:hypothetical protein
MCEAADIGRKKPTIARSSSRARNQHSSVKAYRGDTMRSDDATIALAMLEQQHVNDEG